MLCLSGFELHSRWVPLALYKGGYKQIQIKPYIKPISAFMIPIG